ncbi:MAG: PAS domain S-box protein, partial [Thermodesulfobacteriota bacterium]|nr:PAS domain S-box protein [Thermodesulfobacteriota bacterium]
GTWEWNVQTGETSFNERWADIVGYTLEEISPTTIETWMKLVHPDDLKMSDELLEKHFNGGLDYYECEARMLHKNGDWVWVFDKGKVATWTEDGSPLFMSGIHQDITERKRSEQETRRLATITEQAVEGIAVVDFEGEILFVNNAWALMHGYESGDELVGKNFSIFHTEEQFRTDMIPFKEEVMRRGQNFGEVGHVRKDGITFPTAKAVALLKDEQGAPYALASFARDITKRKRIEKELLEAKEAAEAASQAKSEFLATVSHEIRTPLNGTMGMLQLVQNTKLDAEQEEYVETAIASSKNLLTVLNEILDISRIEAGRYEIVEREFDLLEILETVTGSFKDRTMKYGVHIHYDVDRNLPFVLLGDGNRITQILFNLVGNAVKFTKRGDVHIDVSPLPREKDERYFRLLFSVSDTGMGIPDDKMEYVFELFTQADASYTRKYEGVGLGLGIVRRLVTLMGGTISVESEVGVGTTVYFTVKVKLSRFSLERRRVPFGRRQIGSPSSRFKILVAEDSSTNRMFAVKFLESLGHRVTAVEDGYQVLEALKKERFDLVVMDVQMPKMDGVEATRAIRDSSSRDFDPSIPIIAMTAHAMWGDRDKFIQAGMDDYITKPVDMEEFVDVLERTMRFRCPE